MNGSNPIGVPRRSAVVPARWAIMAETIERKGKKELVFQLGDSRLDESRGLQLGDFDVDDDDDNGPALPIRPGN
jgi:hypothetical protein